ncbi:MAG: type II toxin-antitoxin system prevent-host-death family antitoxin [Deltaproteobacteria bacterium]|nr:type II toxin-antitoxin system prevent-host-death family antitoxin [Deltaproteobacteria bacterium]
MKVVQVHEAKTKLSALLAEVEKTGERIFICRHGKPVADLVPHKRRDRIALHPVMSRIKIDYDPTKPLTEDEWPEISA